MAKREEKVAEPSKESPMDTKEKANNRQVTEILEILAGPRKESKCSAKNVPNIDTKLEKFNIEKELENQVKQLEVQQNQDKLLIVKQIKLEESNKVEQEQEDTINFLDKKNKEFDKKLKKTRVDIKRRNQIDQDTRKLEWCNACHLYLSKIHFCTTVGVWMNIDSFNQHLVIGRNEEDVKRTSNLEGSNYKVYNFTKRQQMREKLTKMGIDEQHFKRL